MSTVVSDTRPDLRQFLLSRVLAQTAQSALLYGLFIFLVAETSSGIWPALFVVASIVPALLFGLIGGVVADHLPRRPLMIALNIIRAVAIAPMLIGDPSVFDLFLLTAIIWIVHQFYSPAESAMLPRLTDRTGLPTATSRYNLALSVAQLLGMVALAPVALKFGQIDVLLVMCAVLYIAASVDLASVRPSRLQIELPDQPIVVEATGFLMAGWKQMVGNARAFAALVDSIMIGIGLSALVVIVPQFLEDVLHTGADNTVFVFAPAAIGLVLGLQVAPVAGRIGGYGRLATGGLLLFCLTIIAIGSVDQVSSWADARFGMLGWLDDTFGLAPKISTTMLLSVPAGFSAGIVNVAIRTELIIRTRPDLHARVFSTQMTIANFCALAPTLLAGVMIDLVGVRLVAVAIGLSIAVGAVFARRIGGETRRFAEGAA